MKLGLAVVFGALAVMVIGCSTTPKAQVEPTQEVSSEIPIAPDFRIADIPVPAGFEIDRDKTFVFQNPLIDVGKITYVGKEQMTSVAQFYIDEMARYGWKLLNVAETETISLYFDKPEKTATILLVPRGRGSVIQISFFPKSQAPR
jgi:hypothetical protein